MEYTIKVMAKILKLPTDFLKRDEEINSKNDLINIIKNKELKLEIFYNDIECQSYINQNSDWVISGLKKSVEDCMESQHRIIAELEDLIKELPIQS